jgi:hypothetical protein
MTPKRMVTNRSRPEHRPVARREVHSSEAQNNCLVTYGRQGGNWVFRFLTVGYGKGHLLHHFRAVCVIKRTRIGA